MSHSCPIDADMVSIAELQESFPGELRTIIRDDRVGKSEMMDEVTDEDNSLFGSDRSDRLCFNPFGELIHRNEQVREAPGRSFERADQVYTPGCEGPGADNGLKLLRREVHLTSIKLAPFAGTYYMLSIKYSGRLVKTLSESFTDQHPWGGMMTASACVDFKE
jgi:hypothetical protein